MVIFATDRVMNPKEVNSNTSSTIMINRGLVLAYLQASNTKLEIKDYDSYLGSLNEEEIQQLIRVIVEEEVLYREAKALKLDLNDSVIKRRLINKIRFIYKGFYESVDSISENDIQDYYQANRLNYQLEPLITFTHVYLDSQKHGASTKLIAEELLAQFTLKSITASDAIEYGDRFLYHSNYVERTESFIASHFGKQMSEDIFSYPLNNHSWKGPYKSPHGYHLVKIINKSNEIIPSLENIKDRVVDDAQQEHIYIEVKAVIEKVIESYSINVDLSK
jgi:hypothetical protein